MTATNRATPQFDERAACALVTAIILKTIKDAAAPKPPQYCTPHEWYQAQLQVVEWMPEFGDMRSGAAFVRKHCQLQSALVKEKEEMERKQIEDGNLAALAKEKEDLQREQTTVEEFLRNVGEASINRIESALVRQRAIEIRLAALTATLETKRGLIRQQS